MAVERKLAPGLAGVAKRLAARLGSERQGAAAAKIVAERAPDERLALAFLLELAEHSPATVKRALSNRAMAGDLVFCLGSSELIASGLTAMGGEWLDCFAAAREAGERTLLEAIVLDVGGVDDRKRAAIALTDFKRANFTRIAIADLVGKSGVAGTMRLMSRLADLCISGALQIATQIMGARAQAAGDFCVLAMGKLGVDELNLSSDLDLVYLFDSPDPRAAQELAAHLGELLTELLSANCFRVDLRLRPGGKNAPLVTSIDGALGFYQNLGETWERAALLRARPAAGNLELGRRLISELEHFVYRRYLDFDTLSQLRVMKRQIEQELRSHDAVQRNIKLGYGGIRELEFIVQALTLVYGGRDRRLREGRTIESLKLLDSLGYLESSRAAEMAEAYLFLRDVEHKLQVVAGLQTHSLPIGEPDVRALAARMGFGKGEEAAADFQTALGRHRLRVAELFHELLAGGAPSAAPVASVAAVAAWQAAADPKKAGLPLKALGFATPEESAGHLTLLAAGTPRASASPRRRELLDRLGPRLLDEMSGLADPDLAMQNLVAFIAAVGARTSFLSLLEQHPGTRRVLLRLFASSSYLSTIFIRHPDMLDTLVRSDLARPRREPRELEAELSGSLAACTDLESRLDALRGFRHQEFLRIAIADLAGALEIEELEAELTALAETVVRAAMVIAQTEAALHTNIPAALRLCTIAMGRLGAAEMSYNSDLDLIFVYRCEGEAAASAPEAAARIVQRLIGTLESRTMEGYAYKIDLRLRQSGNAGPLVASLQGFLEYHRQSSAVWERQALVRARVIAGDQALATEVEAARQEFVFSRGLSAHQVGEIAAMRARMEHEIGAENPDRLNIKQGRGGLADVDFIAQMMALRHGRSFEQLRRRSTADLLGALPRCGLMAESDARELVDGYRFLSKLENRLRIESDQPAWALPTARTKLARVARRMGYEGADGAARLLAELKQRRDRIRAIFDQVFAAEQREQ